MKQDVLVTKDLRNSAGARIALMNPERGSGTEKERDGLDTELDCTADHTTRDGIPLEHGNEIRAAHATNGLFIGTPR